jgi:hypothetical protein
MPRVPDSCGDLDPAHVSRVVAERCGDIYAAAKELRVSGPDLKRLTWARPHLLDEAHEAMEVVVARAHGELIDALYGDNPRRRMWASEKILSSWLARDSPLARARR